MASCQKLESKAVSDFSLIIYQCIFSTWSKYNTIEGLLSKNSITYIEIILKTDCIVVRGKMKNGIRLQYHAHTASLCMAMGSQLEYQCKFHCSCTSILAGCLALEADLKISLLRLSTRRPAPLQVPYGNTRTQDF